MKHLYELNSAGGGGLFKTIDGAKRQAARVLASWKAEDWAKNEDYHLVDQLTWNMESDPSCRMPGSKKKLTAWHTTDERIHRESWAFVITEREVHG